MAVVVTQLHIFVKKKNNHTPQIVYSKYSKIKLIFKKRLQFLIKSVKEAVNYQSSCRKKKK